MSSFSLREYSLHLPAQNNIPCCASSASLKAAEIIMSAAGTNLRLSRLYTFYMSRKLSNKLNHRGLSIKETLDSMIQYGSATDETWPFHLDKVDKEPSEKSIIEAGRYKLDSYLPADTVSFNSHLREGRPIIIGMYTGRMYWKLKGPLEKQFYKPINTTDNERHRNHAVTIIGFDDTIQNGSWIIANSFGLTWGDHGLGILPYDCHQDIDESFVITKFAGITPGEKFLKIDK
jgi:C1A family cysteine protease